MHRDTITLFTALQRTLKGNVIMQFTVRFSPLTLNNFDQKFKNRQELTEDLLVQVKRNTSLFV